MGEADGRWRMDDGQIGERHGARRRFWSCLHFKRRWHRSGSLAPAIRVTIRGSVTAGERAGGEGAKLYAHSAPSPRPSSPTAKPSRKGTSPVGERESESSQNRV